MRMPETTPVIVGVGEYTDRPVDASNALEPIELMVRALRAADSDAKGGFLNTAESLDVVGFITWRYSDPARLLCERLGISPARQTNASMGGETPIRLIHEAAVRIAQGKQQTALIVGGEAVNAFQKAKKDRVKLSWTPLVPVENAVVFPMNELPISRRSKRLGITDPAHIYPFYEMAAEAAWRQSPAEGAAESANLWAQLGRVAAANENAWIRNAPSAGHIGTVTPENRMINWPYSKLMIANPTVNQAAAIIVTSLAAARVAGATEEQIIYIWGGAAAQEPGDFLERDRYDRSTAQAATLEKAVEIAGGDAKNFGHIELYSCFPIVPKLALRTLGLAAAKHVPSVTGGLTFFGGPLNNYMSHAVSAMVRQLREHPSDIGLLYGQGGVVTKHHTMVLSHTEPRSTFSLDYSVQATADAQRGPAPPLAPEDYVGPARIETYTILYGRDGEPIQGVVVARAPNGARLMARVPVQDSQSLALLLSSERNAIGAQGHVRVDVFGKPAWEAGETRRDRKAQGYRFCNVEREGALTIVTINRPDQMNALNPAANGELAEIFDDFAADPEQWVAILTGAGDRAFSAGNDLKHMAKATARGERLEAPLTGFAGLTGRFDLTKPVIAAVNGTAMGGGFEIALACDLIIAAESAVFALPEPRVGVAATEGGLLRLPQVIGLKAAMGLILTGRRVTATEGQQLGFVNEVAPEGQLMEVAKRWATEIMANSPMSVRASKQIVLNGRDEPTLAAAYKAQNRYPALVALFHSEDFREGPLAFAQKRPPQWKGR